VPADRKGSAKRASAQQRIAQKRAAEALARAHAERRRRAIVGGVTAAVLVVIAVVVVVVVQTQRTTTSATAAVPGHTVAGGAAVQVGQASAPVTVDLYEDFQCPTCKAFEQLTGATVAQLVSDGSIKVNYRPIAILDRFSSTEYSTRALNAAGVVADAAGADAFLTFHGLLFANQPAENSAGLSDDELIAFAKQAGASGSTVEARIRDRQYGDWTKKVTDAASKSGLQGTPTIRIDGKDLPLEQATPDGFTAAVKAAANG
jgi:protein-disulfide isomerase